MLSTFAIARQDFEQTKMAADDRSEMCSVQTMFSAEDIETLNSNESYNQDFEAWRQNSPNDDRNQIEIMEYNVEIFIALVQGEPCLWNTSFRAYKEQTKKKNAWHNIAAKFGKDGKSYCYILQLIKIAYVDCIYVQLLSTVMYVKHNMYVKHKMCELIRFINYSCKLPRCD